MSRLPHVRQLLVERFAACDEAVERANTEKARILKQAEAAGIERGQIKHLAHVFRRDQAKARADRRFRQAVERILGARG